MSTSSDDVIHMQSNEATPTLMIVYFAVGSLVLGILFFIAVRRAAMLCCFNSFYNYKPDTGEKDIHRNSPVPSILHKLQAAYDRKHPENWPPDTVVKLRNDNERPATGPTQTGTNNENKDTPISLDESNSVLAESKYGEGSTTQLSADTHISSYYGNNDNTQFSGETRINHDIETSNADVNSVDQMAETHQHDEFPVNIESSENILQPVPDDLHNASEPSSCHNSCNDDELSTPQLNVDDLSQSTCQSMEQEPIAIANAQPADDNLSDVVVTNVTNDEAQSSLHGSTSDTTLDDRTNNGNTVCEQSDSGMNSLENNVQPRMVGRRYKRNVVAGKLPTGMGAASKIFAHTMDYQY